MKLLLAFSLCVCARTTLQAQTVQSSDFQLLKGAWKGVLIYKDYSSGKPVNIPVTAEGKPGGANTWLLALDYPDEPGHGSVNKYMLSALGDSVSGKKVIEKQARPDGGLKIVTEERGEDGNDHRPAVFRHVLLMAKDSFSITKMVRFDGEHAFFRRHVYRFKVVN